MDTGSIYSYGFMYTPGSPKYDLPGTNNQLPAGQVHLDDPKGLLNQDVHNSSYRAVLSTPTAGFPLTVSILTKSTQTKHLRLSALLPLPPTAQ